MLRHEESLAVTKPFEIKKGNPIKKPWHKNNAFLYVHCMYWPRILWCPFIDTPHPVTVGTSHTLSVRYNEGLLHYVRKPPAISLVHPHFIFSNPCFLPCAEVGLAVGLTSGHGCCSHLSDLHCNNNLIMSVTSLNNKTDCECLLLSLLLIQWQEIYL
jgi:hypothetical protein